MAEKTEKKVSVTVRKGMSMRLPNGGRAMGGDTVSIPESYRAKVEYMIEPEKPAKKTADK